MIRSKVPARCVLSALMLIAAAVAWRWGVNAERVSLEGVAAPLSQRVDA